MRLNFLFVGPQRTGTTWLYNHLINHPDICFPKDVKETMFFDRNYQKGLDWYSRHFFEYSAEQKMGEVAPTYFNSKVVPDRIKKHFPNCKIIISLREPIEKARSLYQHHYQKGRVKGTFSQAIKTMPEILISGHYKKHTERWFNNFDTDRILVISTKEMKNTPAQLLNKICSFLDIDEKLLPESINREKVNTALSPRFHGLAKLGSSVVTKLHSWRLHGVMNLAKKLGLKKIFFRKSDKKPGLSPTEREFLEKEYAPHIEYVNQKFKDINL